MQFYINKTGEVFYDYSYGERVPVVAVRDSLNWYYVRLDRWPDLRISEPCMKINNRVRDNYVTDGDWLEVRLPENVVIT